MLLLRDWGVSTSSSLLAILGAVVVVNCGGTTVTPNGCSTQSIAEAPLTLGAPGAIRRDYWLGLEPNPAESSFVNSFRDVISLTTSPTGTDKLTSLQTHGFNPGEEGKTSDYASNFGERMRGFIKPPVTGSYQFLVSGDNQVQFFLSTNDQYASIATAIQGCGSAVLGSNCVTSTAENLNFTLPTSFSEPRQISVPIQLEAGRFYLFEWYHREGQANTHALVKWAKPGESVGDPSALEIVPASALYYPEYAVPSGSGGGGGDTSVSPSASGGAGVAPSGCP
ncbi:MAG: PA14 domain-containing protein [Polyangiaceae bacterium]|nr:PA14 domain-containing protein [Polyangiaceae bacterium]